MKKKYYKYNELFDSSVKEHIERYFKDSYRRDWYISEFVYSPKSEKWFIKWERKL